MKKKVALITGITGQTGSYLAELLIKKKFFSTQNLYTFDSFITLSISFSLS